MEKQLKSKLYTYNTGDIYQPDPDKPGEYLLTIPQELIDEQGWKPGDTIKVEIGDQGSIILSKP